ncbi:MAG: alpha/beta fold hydrolase [bacterium]|nr:alpha/beta fold hydrolase [bacterium]
MKTRAPFLLAALMALWTVTAATAAVPAPAAAGHLDVGSKLYWETHGDAGPVLVLIHDGLVHHEVWDAQIAPFAAAHRVVRYDRRGYGRSEPPTSAYSNRADLLALLDHLGVERAVLVGSSSGGGLATDFALAHPRRVTALVLVGAVVDGLGYSTHFITRNLNNSLGKDIETMIQRWADDRYIVAPGNTAARERLRELLRANPHNFDPVKYRFLEEDDGVAPEARKRNNPEPALRRLGEIAVPTLLVTAAEDIPDVHVHAGALESGITGAGRVVIPGAGHLVYLERPEIFNQVVLEFLSLLSLRFDGVASFERGFGKVRGAELYYESLGEGEPLILLHGRLLDHRMWDPQFEVLARKYRVIRYDARGHGLSHHAGSPYRYWEDLSGLLEDLGLEQAHVMGLSLGGGTAIDFALEQPEKVRSLIPIVPELDGYKYQGEDYLANREQEVAAWQKQDDPARIEAFQRSWTDGHRSPDEVDPALREQLRRMIAGNLRRPRRPSEEPAGAPARERLAELHAPTLLVVGSLDLSDVHTVTGLLAGQIEGAKKVEIAGGAHMVNMEQADELNRIVLEFLSQR